ncbi:hypothetical protein CO2235_MP40092 [Cupriavidus oxalaticus]|uniref:4-hydroxy-tetrahydrodipicolinate synthase n=1 Tax=Cupriavidus oxalaticus TaxID=96344 RepID=A0A976BIA2_9BURK|nr:hypothetical protein CO2235_MP40092 [Cupriavidus oxalaticus]
MAFWRGGARNGPTLDAVRRAEADRLFDVAGADPVSVGTSADRGGQGVRQRQFAGIFQHPHVTALCGEDAALLDHLLTGGAGIVAAPSHIRPDLFLRLLHLAQTGRLCAARALFARLAPLISLLFEEPNPAPVKAALALSGVISPETRLPLQPASAALVQRLEEAMALLPPASMAWDPHLVKG